MENLQLEQAKNNLDSEFGEGSPLQAQAHALIAIAEALNATHETLQEIQTTLRLLVRSAGTGPED